MDFGFKDVAWQDKQSLVGQVFSSVASSYDIMNDLMSGGMHRIWKDRLVETLRPFPGMHHLDVAGGTGDVAFRVLRAIRQAELQNRTPYKAPSSPPASSSSSSSRSFNEASQQQQPSQSQAQPQDSAQPRAFAPAPGSVVVCDINPQMLEVGRKKAGQSPDLAGDPGLSFVEGNAESLPAFADNSFDSYTIAFGIRNVTDREAALREAHRVLKTGGRFLCLEFSHIKQAGLREVYDLYSFNIIPKVGGLVANDSASYQYLVESIRKFPDQDSFAGMIKEAGFKAVTYEDIMGGVVAIHSGFKL